MTVPSEAPKVELLPGRSAVFWGVLSIFAVLVLVIGGIVELVYISVLAPEPKWLWVAISWGAPLAALLAVRLLLRRTSAREAQERAHGYATADGDLNVPLVHRKTGRVLRPALDLRVNGLQVDLAAASRANGPDPARSQRYRAGAIAAQLGVLVALGLVVLCLGMALANAAFEWSPDLVLLFAVLALTLAGLMFWMNWQQILARRFLNSDVAAGPNSIAFVTSVDASTRTACERIGARLASRRMGTVIDRDGIRIYELPALRFVVQIPWHKVTLIGAAAVSQSQDQISLIAARFAYTDATDQIIVWDAPQSAPWSLQTISATQWLLSQAQSQWAAAHSASPMS